MRNLVFVLVLYSTAASAAEFDVVMESVVARDGIASAVAKVTNNTTRYIDRTYVDCVFFDAGKNAVDIGKDIVSNFAPGETRYAKASIPVFAPISSAGCQVVNTSN